MKFKIIRTISDKYYWVNEKNQIAKYEIKDGKLIKPKFSNNWKVIGFRKVLPFNHLSGVYNPNYFLDKPSDEFLYKNGNSKVVLIDYDHGTIRQWGDRICSYFTAQEKFD